ncbi:MAG: D-alanyl-D-alanine carboxypeptidase family protein [Bacillota bacterium]|nr:D-alanyl-D-alanine carboxypeptidase family protein [Bacillota bacterium]
MRLKRAILFILITALTVNGAGAVSVSAHSAVLLDAISGKALFEKDADSRLPMASTTKIMTAVCAIKYGNMDDIITIKKEYILTEGSSMYLKEGEKVTLNCLLHGLLMLSGNDAAQAIAGHISGSAAEFAKLMNSEARRLGLNETSFENPSGLDGENHYTTARDLARLASYAMSLPEFREIVSKKQYTEGTHSMKNHNRMLWSYSGADGIKTGFTKKSGRCLVSSAQKNGRRLIAVTLNASDDWDDHAAMLDYGFSRFEETKLADESEIVKSIPVIGGTSSGVAIFCTKAVSYPLTQEEKSLVKRVISGRHFVYAPVRKGVYYGSMRLTLYGRVICEAPVCFLDSVPAKEIKKRPYFFEKIAKSFRLVIK